MIDLCTPVQAVTSLATTDDRLLALINSGELAAYDIDGQIRFRRSDIRDLVLRHPV